MDENFYSVAYQVIFVQLYDTPLMRAEKVGWCARSDMSQNKNWRIKGRAQVLYANEFLSIYRTKWY
jgi:hypothetical protein